jgi:hypothetical protein
VYGVQLSGQFHGGGAAQAILHKVVTGSLLRRRGGRWRDM